MKMMIAASVVLVGCSAGIAPDPTSSDASSTGHEKTSSSSGGTSDQGATSGSRLKTRTYQGSDGSAQVIGFFDSARNENCAFQKSTDATVRCLPTSELDGASQYFAEATCTVPIGVSSCETDASAYILVPSSGQCGLGLIHVYAKGAPHHGPIYTHAMGGCSGVASAPVGIFAYDIGSEIPAEQFVQATEQIGQ